MENNVEKNKQLCEKYPFLKGTYSDDYEWTWADELPQGWKLKFGNDIWDELKQILEEDNITDFRFEQIKEKYGTLRLYYSPCTDRLLDWSSKYENLSEDICICCGQPAYYFTRGWITFLCKSCGEKSNQRVEKIKKEN